MITQALKLKLILLNILGANLVSIHNGLKPMPTPTSECCKVEVASGTKEQEQLPKEAGKGTPWVFRK